MRHRDCAHSARCFGVCLYIVASRAIPTGSFKVEHHKGGSMPQFGLKMTVKRCRGEQSRWWGSAGNVDVMTYGNKNAYGIGRRSELFTHEDDGP
jgi:hypothetical protein